MTATIDLSTRLRIALVDADPIRVLGFAAAFEQHPRLEFVPLDLSGLVADLKLNISVIGLHGHLDLPSTLSTLRGLRPDILILLMGPQVSDDHMLDHVSNGAKGYLDETATPEMIEQAIDSVRDGAIWAPRRVLTQFVDRANTKIPVAPSPNIRLTTREMDVLKLLVAAQSNREIASALGIEERTVKAHVAKLMRKIGVDNRIALSVYAVRHAMFATSNDLGNK